MKRFYFLILFLAFNIFSFSQNRTIIPLNGEVIPSEIHVGGSGKWVITVDIPPHVHIGDAASKMFYIKPRPVDGIRFGDPIYPKGHQELSGSIYRGNTMVEIPLSIESTAGGGERTLIADVQIQPCGENDGVCYPPEIKNISSKFKVFDAEAPGSLPSAGTGISGKLVDALERGSFLAFFLVFVGGVLTSLTPCVYPMIPITIAVIGAQASGGRLKGFVLSLFYVLGIAITFSALGILAAKTGSLFGTYSQHPAVLIVVSLIFFLMGLSMLGVFILQMPVSLAGRLRGQKRSGFIGAMLTGLVAGLIVSPCISPLLVVILTWVAKTGSAALGVGLLFSFALGLGVLFILIGTFSGILKNLPKSGGWTDYIEKFFGFLLIVLSIYFLRTVVSSIVYRGMWAVLFLFLGTLIGGGASLEKGADWKQKTGKAFGLFAIFISACMIFFGFAQEYGFQGIKSKSDVTETRKANSFWLSSDEEGFAQAKATGRKVLIDFFADWCVACREMDDKTWPDVSVQAELSNTVRIKLDLSRQEENTAVVQKKYNIIGMPTVVLFNEEGKELGRFAGLKTPAEVKDFLRKHATKN